MPAKIEIPKQDILDYYNILELSIYQTGKLLGCSGQTIWDKMKEFDIPRRTISEALVGKKYKHYKKESIKGKNHPHWKGNKVGFIGLHQWVRNNKIKPNSCKNCGILTNKLDCSNKDHKYSRNLEDYQYLCRKCHIKYDILNNNYKGDKNIEI